MTRLLGVLVLLAVGILGLGFYLGWFQLARDSQDQKTNVTFTVDQDKIREDADQAKEKVQGIGHQLKERTGPQKSQDDGPRP
jgi:predicted negative regulator of RcsB-dependent stress response